MKHDECAHGAIMHIGPTSLCQWCGLVFRGVVMMPVRASTPRDEVDAFLASLDWGRP